MPGTLNPPRSTRRPGGPGAARRLRWRRIACPDHTSWNGAEVSDAFPARW